MISANAGSQDPLLQLSVSNVHIGDELPSLSCDIGDLDIDQLLIDNFGDVSFPLNLPMDLDAGLSDEKPCSINSFFLENTTRPRDLNLSLPGEIDVQPLFSNSSNPQNSSLKQDFKPITFPLPEQHSPTIRSGASSPTYSDCSGACCSSSGPSAGTSQDAFKEHRPCRNINPVPRHKRPSHKRAEIKRRDKIKASLDEIKECVPSLQEKGKLSESTILIKAADYIHHLKDGSTDRGNKAAELRQEIETLSTEIHSFQENLPEGGLREKSDTSEELSELYNSWILDGSRNSKKFYVFSCLTSFCFKSFKDIVGPTTTFESLVEKAQEWQSQYLTLPSLRKNFLSGMLTLSSSIVTDTATLELEIKTPDS